jgi:curved DNA-binding protein CbpA
MVDTELTDWYAIVKCSIDSSKEDIAHAVRKLSLKYHPDKTKNDPKGTEIFLQIQNAKNFLLDDVKRAEYDEALRKTLKRKQYDVDRVKNMDGNRKKLKQEFEERLRKASGMNPPNAPTQAPSTNESKMKSKDYIEKLRKENLARMNESDEKMRQKEIDEAVKANSNNPITNIKVKWKRSDQSYSEDMLFQLFKEYGEIGDIKFIGSKGDAAQISFLNTNGDNDGANKAILAYVNSSKFRVTIIDEMSKKVPSIFTHKYGDSSNNSNPVQEGSFPNSSSAGNGESDLLREMKRAVEREQLLQQLQSESDSKTSNPYDASGVKATSGGINTDSSNHLNSHNNNQNDTADVSSQKINSSTLASKENDVLTRMMEASLRKKMLQKPLATTADP